MATTMSNNDYTTYTTAEYAKKLGEAANKILLNSATWSFSSGTTISLPDDLIELKEIIQRLDKEKTDIKVAFDQEERIVKLEETVGELMSKIERLLNRNESLWEENNSLREDNQKLHYPYPNPSGVATSTGITTTTNLAGSLALQQLNAYPPQLAAYPQRSIFDKLFGKSPL